MDTPQIITRCTALLQQLRQQSLSRPDLLERLGSIYPTGDSGRRMLERDIATLAQLGIMIDKQATRPPIYQLRGGQPCFTSDEIRSLALIRHSFHEHHPQTGQIQQLLDRLTNEFSETEQQLYQRSPATTIPLTPAIDYSPYVGLIKQLEQAIHERRMIRFAYQSLQRAKATNHAKVEPYAIEFYERHYYLVGYSHHSNQVHDFRIDRIAASSINKLNSRFAGRRHLGIRFRYRLAAQLAQGEISQRFDDQHEIDRLENGDVIIEARGRSEFFVIQTLLRYGGNAELLEPAALRQQMITKIEAMVKMYQT